MINIMCVFWPRCLHLNPLDVVFMVRLISLPINDTTINTTENFEVVVVSKVYNLLHENVYVLILH